MGEVLQRSMHIAEDIYTCSLSFLVAPFTDSIPRAQFTDSIPRAQKSQTAFSKHRIYKRNSQSTEFTDSILRAQIHSILRAQIHRLRSQSTEFAQHSENSGFQWTTVWGSSGHSKEA